MTRRPISRHEDDLGRGGLLALQLADSAISQQNRARTEVSLTTLVGQALSDANTNGGDTFQTLTSMREAIDRKIAEQVDLVLQHPDLRSVETSWRRLYELVARMPEANIRVLDISDEEHERLLSGAQTSSVELKGSGLGPLLSREEGAARLDAIAVDDASVDWLQSPVLGAGEMALQLGVARATLDNWRRAHRALAFRKGVRNFVYPTRQFVRRAPVVGLDRVRGFFSEDEECWDWLVRRNRLTEGNAPIDWLNEGRVEEVVRAAEGALDYL
jgi:hypothetical protein